MPRWSVAAPFGPFLCAVVFVAILAPCFATLADAVLLHRWSGDGVATDSIGTDDGQPGGGVSYGQGLFGQGFLFDGLDDNIGFGASAGNFGAGDFTLAFVIRTTATPVITSVLGKREKCMGGSYWDLRSYANGTMILELLAGYDNTGLTTKTAINDGLFHTVVFTRAGSIVSAYVDGFLDSQNDAGFVADVSNAASLSAGVGACTGADGTVAFAGLLDEIRLDDSANPSLLPAFLHCGDANGNGSISATDALVVLRRAVGGQACDFCLCDPNQSSTVTASDALVVLKRGVGQTVSMLCPLCPVELPD